MDADAKFHFRLAELEGGRAGGGNDTTGQGDAHGPRRRVDPLAQGFTAGQVGTVFSRRNRSFYP